MAEMTPEQILDGLSEAATHFAARSDARECVIWEAHSLIESLQAELEARKAQQWERENAAYRRGQEHMRRRASTIPETDKAVREIELLAIHNLPQGDDHA